MRSEFEFIDEVRTRYHLTDVGDDCAVLPKDDATELLVTADLLIEDVDFRLRWTTPESLGHKALAVSLSDIAAMGGSPTSALLSIAVPESLWKTEFLDLFYASWHKLAGQHGIALAGGDTSRSPGRLMIDSIALGEAPRGKAIRRAGARAGDAIFVTGFLGGAAAGLELLERGSEPSHSRPPPLQHLLQRQLQPIPQVATAKLLQEFGLPTAMIDISDGLAADLGHIIHASDVGAVLDAGTLPIDPALAHFDVFADRAADLALGGGEDFELLFTTRKDNVAIALDLGFHRIGEITDRTGRIELMSHGRSTTLDPAGFQHF